MSFMISVNLQCDNCGEWDEGEMDQPRVKSMVLKAFKERGWRRMRKGNSTIDLCPTCARLPKEKRS